MGGMDGSTSGAVGSTSTLVGSMTGTASRLVASMTAAPLRLLFCRYLSVVVAWRCPARYCTPGRLLVCSRRYVIMLCRVSYSLNVATFSGAKPARVAASRKNGRRSWRPKISPFAGATRSRMAMAVELSGSPRPNADLSFSGSMTNSVAPGCQCSGTDSMATPLGRIAVAC